MQVGGLLAWKGTVTRTTEVRPELALATYRCGLCGELQRNVQQNFVMTYPSICSAAACGNKKIWKLVKEESSFVDWQRAKVQENADEVSLYAMSVLFHHRESP
jgi:DNA replication licensing factor MCM6